jgi:hypothetical protein
MITLQVPYTRRYFENEEVIISSCNYCLSVVAESSNEAELQAREEQHSCSRKTIVSSHEQSN